MTRTDPATLRHTRRYGVRIPLWPRIVGGALLTGLLTSLPAPHAQDVQAAPVPATCSGSSGILLGTPDGSGGILRRLEPRRPSTVVQRFPAPVTQLLCGLDPTAQQTPVAAMTADGRVWLGVPGQMRQIARARGDAPYLLFGTRDPRPACTGQPRPEPAACPTHLLVLSSERSLLGRPGTRVEIMMPRARFLGRTVKSWRLPDVRPAAIDFQGLLGQLDRHVVLVSWQNGHEYDRSRGPGPDDAGQLHAVAETKLYTGVERTTGRAWLVQSDSISTECPRLDVTLPGPPMADLPILIPDNPDVPERVSVFGRERATGRWRGWEVTLQGGTVRTLTLPPGPGTLLTIHAGPEAGFVLVTRQGEMYRGQLWTP